MSEIIDFSTKENLKGSSHKDNLSVLILKDILKGASTIEDLLVFVKTVDGEISLYHTGLPIKDRSYIVQLLSADIQHELAPTEDLEEDL